MHFASEVLTPEELNRPKTELNEKELKMAHALIESMSSTWEPQKYRDEYRDAVMELIEQKANKKEIAPKVEVKARATNVVDLVKVLQESLNQIDHIGSPSLYLDLGRDLFLVSFLLDHLHHGIPIFVPIFLWLPHTRHAFDKGVRHFQFLLVQLGLGPVQFLRREHFAGEMHELKNEK